MFIQNQVSHLKNHRDIITTEIDNADEILFVVAYVRENGVDIILDKIKGKPTKLLCSLDMGITQLSGIKRLIQNGVEVKVYKSNEGTFHPKIWLFGKNKTNWKMLIGSANLTRAAFIDNVEASVLVDDKNTTSNALMFFNYLWDKENSSKITIDEVNSLQKQINERKVLSESIKLKENKNDIDKNKILFEYVKSWIDIPKYDSKDISSLWRGWYIIPDQGYVSNQSIKHLEGYLSFIDNSMTIGENSQDKSYQKLLDRFKNNSNFQRKNLKTSIHGLFTRQAKNYLLKFGWCYQPNRNTLCLTDLGIQIKQCQHNIECIKKLYSEYFYNYSFGGLTIIQFTKQLLLVLEYLTINEFNFFVVHAYNNDDLDIMIKLVKIYRSLSSSDKFQQNFKKYFEEVKGGTAKGVYMNYVKNIKHTMSVIGWCNGFSLSDSFKLRLDNAT